MAWDRRNRSSSGRRGGSTATKELEWSSSSLQPWACSSLSSSEKFLSLYDKMSEDLEKKNLESLVSTRYLEEAPLAEDGFPSPLPPTMFNKRGSKIVFPHITSRGSLVGNKMYCRTSIQSSIPRRQKSSTQQMRTTSLMVLNFYHQDRSISSNNMLVLKQRTTQGHSATTDSVTSQSKQDHSPDKEQCRALFLRLAGAAGMRLICPPLQLPVLEILLFFRQQLSSKNRRGLWRFPVNLALATVRPFCGSLLRRCLTAMLCLSQMRVNTNLTTEQALRYMPVADLYSVAFEKEHLDRKEFTICTTNLNQIGEPVATGTTEAELCDCIDRASRNMNGTLVSNVVARHSVEDECWSKKNVPVVEILICESLSEINNVPNFVFEDQDKIGSEDFLFSLVDLALEDDKLASLPRPFLKHKESEGFVSVQTGSGNVFVATPKGLRNLEDGLLQSCQSPHATAEEARTESLHEFERSITFTNVICGTEGEKPEYTPVSKTNCNLETTMNEIADGPCSPCKGERNEAAAAESLENATPSGSETVENKLVNEFQDGEVVLFVEGESTTGQLELELEVGFIGEHKVCAHDCVSTESLQEPREAVLSEEASAENELREAAVMVPVEKFSQALTEALESQSVKDTEEVKSEHCVEENSTVRILDCIIEQHTIGGSDCLSVENLEDQMFEFLPDRAGADDNEHVKVAVTTPEEKLPASTDEVENHAVMEIDEAEFERYLDELPSDTVLDCPIEDLIASLLEQTEVYLSNAAFEFELEEAAETGPVEKLSSYSTEAAEDQSFREIQEVKPILSVEEESAYTVLDQEQDFCPFEEHPNGGSPCVLPERLHDETEASPFESNCDANELGNDAVTVTVEMQSQDSEDVLEDDDIKEIQEVILTYSGGETSAERVGVQELDIRPIEDNRIDDGSCISSKRLQDSPDGFLSVRACFDNEFDETELPAAVTVPVESTSQALAEGLENEAVKEIHEVTSARLIDWDSEDLFERDLEIGPIEDHRIVDSEFVLSETVKTNSHVSFCDRITSENEIEKGSIPAAQVSLPVEAQSSASTKVLENQLVKELEEVESTPSADDESAESFPNQELEASPIDDDEIDHTSYASPERLQKGQAEGFLPETISPEFAITKESDNLKGGLFLAEFDGEVRIPKQDDCAEQEPLPLSPITVSAMESDDVRSEDTSLHYHYGYLSKGSCREQPESNLTSWTSDGVSELSTHTLLTCRLNSATTEGEGNALDPSSGAIAVLTDETNRDLKHDEHSEETEAQVVINSNSIFAHESKLPPGPTVGASLANVVLPSADEQDLDQSSAVADKPCVQLGDNCLPELCPIISSTTDTCNSENRGVPESCPEHPFADHPTCIELRKSRHSHEDQTYIDMKELLPAPWGKLIFWHGRCKEGRPTLCVLLGKAVRQLPGHELKHFIAVTVSHVEYAEVNFFNGNVKQLNILMDLEGLGFMRLPPMHILSSIGSVLNRDYAGRGGWIILVNAPMMLGFVINAIQGVILRPQQNKGAVIDSSFRGFLEGKEKIMMMGGRYRPVLLRHFDACMLPNVLGGDCTCNSDGEPCKVGNEFLKLPWNTSSDI